MDDSARARAWFVALGAFLFAFLVNTAFFAVDIPLGWGLRGSDGPGRPTPADVRMMHALDAAFWIALAVNVGLPLALAAARKWRGLLGVLVAWMATPLAWVGAVVIDAALSRAL